MPVCQSSNKREFICASVPVFQQQDIMSDAGSDDEGVEFDLELALQWIGFEDQAQRQAIMNDAFVDFDDMKSMKVKEISEIAYGFSKRAGNAKIIFGHRRMTRIKELVHWVQDFYRCNREVEFDGETAEEFKEVLKVASQRQEVREAHAESSDTLSREASPGKLEDEKKWPEWIASLENYLSTMQGSNGVPLSYVIRKSEESLTEQDTEGWDFMEVCTACAPLTGPWFDADKRQVHQIVVGFTQGTTAENWIKSLKNKNDGRRDVAALRAHFAGEGNSSRRIAEAERLRDTLHYKGERIYPFEKFLTGIKRMLTIFAEEDQEWTEDAQCRFLLKKVQHSGLVADVAALKARKASDSTLTFTMMANQLAASVSELPDTIAMKSRGVSGVGTNGSGGTQNGIYSKDGSIFTGYYKNWGSMSKEDRQQVVAERAKLGVTANHKGRQSATSSSKKQVTKLKYQLKKVKRKVSALRKANKKNSDGSEGSDDESVPDDAGNQFGGKESKRSVKSKRS